MNNVTSLVLAIALSLSTGCAQVQSVVKPNPQQLTEAERQAIARLDHTGKQAANADLSVRVVRSVLPGSPDYFPKEASWAEYVLEFRTFDRPIRLMTGTLVSPQGEAFPPAMHSLELSKAPNQTMEQAKSVGIMTGSMAAGLATGIPLVGPLIMLGHSFRAPMKARSATKYQEAFAAKIKENMSRLDSHAMTTFSVFFPMVNNARAIVVEYEYTDGGSGGGRLEVPLSGEMTQSAPPTAVAETTAPLSIREAQVLLQSLGLNPGPADGLIGQRTIDAIRQFQRINGLSPTGELDQPTSDALRRLGERD